MVYRKFPFQGQMFMRKKGFNSLNAVRACDSLLLVSGVEDELGLNKTPRYLTTSTLGIVPRTSPFRMILIGLSV